MQGQRQRSLLREHLEPLIKEYVEKDVVTDPSLTPDDIVWAAAIWQQIDDYRAKSEELIKSVGGKDLLPDKKATLGSSRGWFVKLDFLDAYRLPDASGA